MAVNYRSGSEAADSIAAEIGGIAFGANVGDPAEAQALIERVESELGEIDILVNNAGVTRDTLIARMSDEDWAEVIDTNLRGTFNTCRAVSRKMLRRRSGAIVNLSSVVGVHGNPGQANYAASKAGIIGLTKALARELGVPRRPRERDRAGLHHHGAHRRADGGADRPHPRQHASRPARDAGGRGRCGTLSLL